MVGHSLSDGNRSQERFAMPAPRKMLMSFLRAIGTALISLSLVWLGLWAIFGGLSQGVLPLPRPWTVLAQTSAAVTPAIESGGYGYLVGPVDKAQDPLTAEPPSLKAVLPAATGIAARASLPPVHIQAPAIELDASVVPIGTKMEKGQLVWETAKWAVGHHQGSANPGDSGNIVLSGHIRSPIKKEGNVFNRLPKLPIGELIVLHTEQGEYRYRVVDRRIVEPQEIEWMGPTAISTLTLITCYPDWIYSHRLVVIAYPEVGSGAMGYGRDYEFSS